MIEQVGANILIPIGVFVFLCVGAYLVSDVAFKDVIKRRGEGQ